MDPFVRIALGTSPGERNISRPTDMVMSDPSDLGRQTGCGGSLSADARARLIAGAIAPHLPALRRLARKLTRNPVNADDLVQDCLERAIRQWDQLRTPSAPGSWLNAILRNAWISDRRSASRRGEDCCGDVDQHMASTPAAQDQRLLANDILHAVDRLPPGQRDAVRKVAIESLSYREAAEALGVPVGTIMSRLSRARMDLRDRFLVQG